MILELLQQSRIWKVVILQNDQQALQIILSSERNQLSMRMEEEVVEHQLLV
jgi:hypothetical protein